VANADKAKKGIRVNRDRFMTGLGPYFPQKKRKPDKNLGIRMKFVRENLKKRPDPPPAALLGQEEI
jgi:hypothetical protein